MHTRVIDTVIHQLTGPQVLEKLLRLFAESKSQPIYLGAEIGEGDKIIKQARVELSRLRKKYDNAGLHFPQFGFVVHPMDVRTTSYGIVVEYHQIDFRLTQSQQFKMFAEKHDSKGLI